VKGRRRSGVIESTGLEGTNRKKGKGVMGALIQRGQLFQKEKRQKKEKKL